MALRVSVETPYQITCDNAHCVIRDVRVDKQVARYDDDGEEIEPKTFTVQYSGLVYATEDAYNDGASPVSGFNFNFDFNTNESKNQYNLYKQAYLHLKEQEGYEDGEDC